MTPDCCIRAWAKATSHEVKRDGANGLWIYKGYSNHWIFSVPAPTSAEWLADCIRGLIADGWTVELGVFEGGHFALLKRRVEGQLYVEKGNGLDECRALCAALNGSPCERKAA